MCATFAHAVNQHFQVVLEQNEIGGFARDINRAIYRQTDIGRVQRRGIIYPVADVADNVAGLFTARG